MTTDLSYAAPQYERVRRASYAGETLVTFFSNTVVFAGQLNTDLSLVTSWAQFDYNNVTVGAYTDVRPGQVLIIGTVDDIAKGSVQFYGRIRKAPTSSIIYSNESSQNFTVGAYFWVIDNHLPQYILSRPSTDDAQTAVELWDYDETFSRMLPAIVGLQTVYVGYVNPLTGKLRIAFDVSASFAVESGATIASVAYTFPAGTVVGGGTGTAIVVVDFDPGDEMWAECAVTDSGGRTLTRYFGIKVHDPDNFPPDTGIEGLSYESNPERGWMAKLPAFTGVDDLLINTTVVIWRANERYGSEQKPLFGGGYATVSHKQLASNTVQLTTSAAHGFEVGQEVVVAIGDSIYDGTYVITSVGSTTFTYHRVHADSGSASASGLAVVNARNIEMVGWVTNESDPYTFDPATSGLGLANFNVWGVAARLARLTAQKLPFINTASPTEPGQIVELTPYRAEYNFMTRYLTLRDICEITVDEFTTAFQFGAIATLEGNALAAIQGMAKQINAAPTFYPAGQIRIAREVGFLSDFSRGSLQTIANWEDQDGAIDLTREYDPQSSTGIVDWTGLFYNPTNGAITGFQSRAPGHAQGEAPGVDSRGDQILLSTSVASAALDELRQRVGDQYVLLNNNETLAWKHPDGYVELVPTRSKLYTWLLTNTLGSSHGVNRVIYAASVSWVLENISIRVGNNGEREVSALYRRVLPPGDLGDNTTQSIPAPDSIPDFTPDLGIPAFPWEDPSALVTDEGWGPGDAPPSALATGLTLSGQELFIWESGHAALLRNFINLTTPQATDVTPGTILGSIKQGNIDPDLNTAAVPGYVLEDNGTDGLVSWNPNLGLPGASAFWQDGVDLQTTAGITGSLDVMRVTKTSGGVLVVSFASDIAPPPAPPNCLSPSAFPAYGSINYGTLISGGDTSALALSVTGSGTRPGDGTVPIAMITYNFASPVTVTSAIVSYRNINGSGHTLFIGASYYAGVTNVWNKTFGPTGPIWPTWFVGDVLDHAALSSITKVEVYIWQDPGNFDAEMSDVEICYT